MPNALNDLLKATSSSFYLIPHCGTLLPVTVRPQIGLAYQSTRHFHRPFRTNKFPHHHQGHRPWLISGVALRPNIVPKAQPDISQLRSGWYRGKMKIRPEGNTLQIRPNITGRKHFRRNTWHFSKNITLNTMKNICGNVFRRPLRAKIIFYSITRHCVAG